MPRRRRRSVAPWIVLGITIGAGLGAGGVLVYHAHRSRKKVVTENPTVEQHEERVTPSAVEQQEERVTPSGIDVVDGRIVIPSVDAWRSFGQRAIRDGLRRGARNADELLAYVMRMALPAFPWPPTLESSLLPQWIAMRDDVASMLRFEPEPQPEQARRLSLITT